MSVDELAKPISARLRGSVERLSSEIAVHVVSKLSRAVVAARAVLSHGFERDPLELAPQLAGRRFHLELTTRGDLRRGLSERGEVRAGPRRLDFPYHAAELVVRGSRQHLPIKGRHSDEQLVQHDAKRVHVR